MKIRNCDFCGKEIKKEFIKLYKYQDYTSKRLGDLCLECLNLLNIKPNIKLFEDLRNEYEKKEEK